MRGTIYAFFLSAASLAVRGAFAQDTCANPANAVVAENCKTGNLSTEWDIPKAGDPSIVGFSTEISVNRGETVDFKIHTDASQYRIDIYRLGFYRGAGARKVASISPSAVLPQIQPACLSDSSTGLVDCGNWAVSASWSVPAEAVSGVYFAKLTRADTGGASHIFFVVRDDAGRSDILFQTSDTTWQAYNRYGGGSLYVAPSMPFNRAYKVSYNRPFTTRNYSSSWVLGHEYPMIRWLEANGYDVSYFTGVDSDRRGELIRNHKVFLSVGHDEYWSGPQRKAVEAARDAGVHLGFFSSNEIYWKIRWEPSIDATKTPHRTMVCYKESVNNTRDPMSPPSWTGYWWDHRFSPPSDGGKHPNSLSGQEYTVGPFRNDALIVPSDFARHRFWRNTSVASLTPGTESVYEQILGYEWDEDIDNGYRPAGLMHLSSSSYAVDRRQLGPGYTYIPGTATHTLTLYRSPSGARVFGAGTMQWTWGLDSHHDAPNPPQPAYRDLQQATRNLLADMDSQPGSPQANLVAAFASADSQAPSSGILSPSEGTVFSTGTAVLIAGTAADSGGGIVGAVEVSVDGGASWRPAKGREAWSYEWKPSGSGGRVLMSRAVDDSGNQEAPSRGVGVGIGGPAPAPQPSNPIPRVFSLSPGFVTAGQGLFSLQAIGEGFAAGATLQFNGADRQTRVLSPNRLEAVILSEDVRSTGTAQITVFNPPPGGGRSPWVALAIRAPAPAISPGGMQVFPNPWKSDRHGGVPVVFDLLGEGSTVKIFTLSGKWLKSLRAVNGKASWDLTNDAGQAVASGFYLYVITDSRGGNSRGRIAVLK